MKGAIVINLEALGAGALSCIEQEGAYKPYKISSRLKRVLRQASERSGVGYHTDRIVSRGGCFEFCNGYFEEHLSKSALTTKGPRVTLGLSYILHYLGKTRSNVLT